VWALRHGSVAGLSLAAPGAVPARKLGTGHVLTRSPALRRDM